MLSVLHYLYKNIPDIVILPLCLEENFQNHINMHSRTEVQVKTEELKKSLQKEVGIVEEFFERYRIHCDNADDKNAMSARILECFKNFRQELNEQELKSDLLYSALKNCANDHENDELDDISM